jgi:hypothetical protein
MRCLKIRLARGINRVLTRRGEVFTDRYHAVPKGSPREVKRLKEYVLLNARHHGRWGRGIDPCSSGAWFTGWHRPLASGLGPSPVVEPRTWLGGVGWRQHHGPVHLPDC